MTVGPSKTGIDFIALSTFSVSGRVTVDSAGLSGVLITSSNGSTTTTDSNGNYTLSGLVAGTYVITPSKDEFTFTPPNRTVTVGPSKTGIDFTATQATYTISGPVTAGGLGLAGVVVSATGGATAMTDDDGNYTLTGLVAGTYVIGPSKPEYTFVPPFRSVTVGPSKTGVDCRSTAGTYTISGRVTTSGVGLADVEIRAAIGAATLITMTDDNGNYTLSGLVAGTYYVTSSKDEYTFIPPVRTLTLGPDRSDVDFVATRNTYSISGQVTENGVGLPGVLVARSCGVTTMTDSNGEYVFTGLVAGVCLVAPSVDRSVTVGPSQTNVNFIATWQPQTYCISGFVKDPSGRGMPNVLVRTTGASARTAANGQYILCGLTEGKYSVTPQRQGYTFSPPTRRVTVPPSRTNVNFVGATGLRITTASPLPAGMLGQTYSCTLDAVGGLPPLHLSVALGSSLPADLSLSDNGVLAGVPEQAGIFTFTIKVTDSGRPQQTDTKAFSLTITSPYVPDVQIRNVNETSYAGDHVYNTYGTNQTKSQLVLNNITATYFLNIQNDGSVADTLKVAGPAGGPGWTVEYWDGLSGGTNITNQVTGAAGWSTGVLAPGASREIRLQVTPGASLASGSQENLITATSSTDPTKADAAKAITTMKSWNRPDALIRNATDHTYIGDDIYNNTRAGQTKSQTVARCTPAIYIVKIQNDGAKHQYLWVRGTTAGPGWRVKYFSEADGRYDVTDAVTGSGWLVNPAGLPPGYAREMRVEVCACDNLAIGSTQEVSLTTAATGDATVSDTVKAVTTVGVPPLPKPWSKADEHLSTPKDVDLCIVDLNVFPNPGKRGGSIAIVARVRNIGTSPVRGALLRLKQNGEAMRRYVKFPVWLPREEFTRVFRLAIPQNLAPGDYAITAELVPVAGENNTTNNSQTVKVTVR